MREKGRVLRYESGSCGTEVPEGSRACSICGIELAEAGQAQTTVAPAGRRALAWVVDLIAITLIWGAGMALVGSLAPGTDSEDGGLAGLIGPWLPSCCRAPTSSPSRLAPE